MRLIHTSRGALALLLTLTALPVHALDDRTITGRATIVGVAVLVLTVLGGVGWLIYSHRRRRPRLTPTLRARRVTRRAPRPTPSRRRFLVATVRGRARASGGLEMVGAGSTQLIPTFSVAPGIKACVRCSREFDALLDRCPFDGQRLIPRGGAGLLSQRTDGLDERVSQSRCRECYRCYELGARFCPHDGLECDEVSLPPGEAVVTPRGRVCGRCATSHAPDVLDCPHDGDRLLIKTGREEQPHEVRRRVILCAACFEPCLPQADACPGCGVQGPRTLLAGRGTVGAPATGVHPLTRVCPRCGARHGTDMRFCAVDGARLMVSD